MTATATPTNQAMAEWTKVFQRQATENYTSSLAFMKQLTVVAISTITYLRNIFPNDSYMVESFGGVKLRILKKKCHDELAQFLSTALIQSFEAFDKKYLHQLALCFYEDECKIENLIEYYVFEYSYNADGVTMNVNSKNRDNIEHSMKYTFENVKEMTIQLIKTCVVVMQSCEVKLPTNFDVSLRLYYNEDAPIGYQAPGFSSTEESQDHLEPTLPEAASLGWVETKYHKLIAKSYIKDYMRASHEAIASQTAPVLSNGTNLSGSAIRSESGIQLVCPCNKYDGESYDPSELLECDYCHTFQHAACYGVRGSVGVAGVSGVVGVAGVAGVARRHCCAPCARADPQRTPTDTMLVGLTPKKEECLCIFRRTLEWCSQLQEIETKNLTERFRISDANASKLMKLLKSHGIIRPDPNNDMNGPMKIRSNQLKLIMGKFFNTEENIVDRLLAETFASQESTPDPIGEVLSPLEKVTLQNTSTIGRVIDNPNRNENSALNEYREAILSNDEPSVMEVRKAGKRKANDGERIIRTGMKTKRARNSQK